MYVKWQVLHAVTVLRSSDVRIDSNVVEYLGVLTFRYIVYVPLRRVFRTLVTNDSSRTELNIHGENFKPTGGFNILTYANVSKYLVILILFWSPVRYKKV